MRAIHLKPNTTVGAALCLIGLWLAHVQASVLRHEHNDVGELERNINTTATGEDAHLLSRADNDPSDFSWVKRFAGVGDSFTAGIGSGAPLASFLTEAADSDDWYCARYDTSYPEIIYNYLGSSVDNFQFVACSGDRTGDIYTQIQNMEGDLDMVVMTAGGNDLCLASMIKNCVLFPYYGEDSCTSVIDIAQQNLDNILKDNLLQLMEALDSKMNDDGIVIFNGYAQFFNTENDDCATNQDWTLLALGSDPLRLTVDRRKTFNDLVVQINAIIKSVVEETAANDDYKWKIGFSNWDVWPQEGVAGQMCDPSSTGSYPDSSQPNLQFFKPNTHIASDTGDLKIRSSDGSTWYDLNTAANETMARNRAAYDQVMQHNRDVALYNSILLNSVNPQAEVLHRLDARAPSPPGCPGDDDSPTGQTRGSGIPIPNSIGKLFHPNELGHYTIASWALQTAMDLRAEVLGVDSPECSPVDKFTCYQTTGSKAYTDGSQLNDKYKDFCNGATEPSSIAGWKSGYSQTYFSGTVDEVEFWVGFSADATDSIEYDADECIDSMDRVINSCDGNDPKNPMDWKFGGEWQRGGWVYRVSPQRTNRPWPVIQSSHGSCEGWYKFLWGSYEIEGAGFSSYDNGDGLQQAAKDCVGGGITKFSFTYYDEPTSDGYEWKATFRTPIWSRARCFNNNKVVFKVGGFTNGCGGND